MCDIVFVLFDGVFVDDVCVLCVFVVFEVLVVVG